jgi:hypothetical protein
MNQALMQRGSMLRIKDARGALLQIRQGAVWLTQEGDPEDRYLGAGAHFRLDRDGIALVQALGAQTKVALIPARREAGSFWTRLLPA